MYRRICVRLRKLYKQLARSQASALVYIRGILTHMYSPVGLNICNATRMGVRPVQEHCCLFPRLGRKSQGLKLVGAEGRFKEEGNRDDYMGYIHCSCMGCCELLELYARWWYILVGRGWSFVWSRAKSQRCTTYPCGLVGWPRWGMRELWDERNYVKKLRVHGANWWEFPDGSRTNEENE